MEYTTAVYVERLGIPPLDVSDTTIAPHVLCPQCENIISESSGTLQAYISEAGEFGQYRAYWENGSYARRPALHTMKSLQESAQGGCHLCYLFYTTGIGSGLTESQPLDMDYSISFDPLESCMTLMGPHNRRFYSSLPFSLIKSTGTKIPNVGMR